MTEGGRTEPNPVDDKGVVWGIPALNLISTRSEYIGTMGIPLVFDIVVYQVLIYYFHVWYPIAFAVSCLVGAAVQKFHPPGLGNASMLPPSLDLVGGWSGLLPHQHRPDNAHCDAPARRATIGRALAAGVISRLAFARQNLLAMQRRHLLVGAEQQVLR